MMNWETAKRPFTGREDKGIPMTMTGAMKKFFLPDDDDGDEYVFPTDVVKSFFDAVIDKIKALIANQLEATPGISVVFLVGGFAESAYLQDTLKASFQTPDRTVVTVPKASESILIGAVMIGLLPNTFESRCMRTTLISLDDEKDPKALLITTKDGKRYCRDRFHVFVSIGQEVKVDEVIKHRFKPDRCVSAFLIIITTRNILTMHRLSLMADLSIVVWSSSTNPRPRYANRQHQPDVQTNAALKVPTAAIANFGEKGIEIAMTFGKTVMELKAIDLATGRSTKPIQMKFSDHE